MQELERRRRVLDGELIAMAERVKQQRKKDDRLGKVALILLSFVIVIKVLSVVQ